MSWMWMGVQEAFAGLWAEIWHWGIGIVLIVLLVGGSVFSQSIPFFGPYLAPVRKDMLWAAAAIALLLGGEWIGTHDEKARCVAQQVVVNNFVDKVTTKSHKQRTLKYKDPYDDPKN